ncbi:hypothetical protein FQA39_LY06025 [Lamprigera yunnana]|nr:hypothetical protein FQA39_LY06025 [Lamprigera yunnana]
MPPTVGDNAISDFRYYRSAQTRFPWEPLSVAASALNADNSDIEDDVAETTSTEIADCDLSVPEDEEEDEENEEEDEENIENKISDSEIEASGNSRRTNKAISNLKCKNTVNRRLFKSRHRKNHGLDEKPNPTTLVPLQIIAVKLENHRVGVRIL